MEMRDNRHAPTGKIAEGLIVFITEDGLSEKTQERIRFCLLAAYEQGMKDGLDMAKVLSGKNVYSKRRPPPQLDPTSAYDS